MILNKIPNLLEYDTEIIIFNLLKFFILTTIPYFIYYVKYKEKYRRAKLQSNKSLTNYELMKYEINNSLRNILVATGIFFLFFQTDLKKHTLIYDELYSNVHPFWLILISFIAILLIHDTYFYWMHKIIHNPKIFKYVHLVHHKSVNINPFSTTSFHIIESIAEYLFLIIVFVFVPMNIFSLAIYGYFSLWYSVYLHLGYETMPRWFRNSFLFQILITSTHHNNHHLKFKYNYGLYFRFWDRIMKTEDPNYVKDFESIQHKRFNYENDIDNKLSKN